MLVTSGFTARVLDLRLLVMLPAVVAHPLQRRVAQAKARAARQQKEPEPATAISQMRNRQSQASQSGTARQIALRRSNMMMRPQEQRIRRQERDHGRRMIRWRTSMATKLLRTKKNRS